MEKYLQAHISLVEDSLKKKKAKSDWQALKDFNRTQIGFFQHERLIHLLITLFFGLLFFGSVVAALFLASAGSGLISLNIGLLIVSDILLIMLGFYIRHYFILENGIQKLYRLDREIVKR